MPRKINLAEAFGRIDETYSPRIAGEVNDFQVKIVKVQGAFVWHHHEEEDELFLVVKGRLLMHFRDGDEWIEEGEMIVVPHGVEHCPDVPEGEAHVLLIERAGTPNTGSAGGERTVEAVPLEPGRMTGDRDAGTDAWHRKLHHTGHDELSEDTAQTPGMRRYEAISGKRNGSRKIWMGKNHVAPGMVSADHHHGEAETGIYVVSGHPVFVFLEDGAGAPRRDRARRLHLRPAVRPAPRGEPLARRGGRRRAGAQHAGGHRRQPAQPAGRGAGARRADRPARRGGVNPGV